MTAPLPSLAPLSALRNGLAVFLATLTLAAPTAAQVTPEQVADMVLASARRAYNDKNYPFAATRFREFLAKHGNHKEAPTAHYGLALTLLALPEKDYQGAVEQLQPLAGNKEFAEHPHVLYQLGLAQRGLGVKALSLAAAKPQEAAGQRTVANQRFEEASRQFATAVTAFTARAKEPTADVKELPLVWEWAARARCDQAEMLARLNKSKETREAVAPFLDDKILQKSRYRGLGLYYHGYASFLLKDFAAAGRSLGLLAPFSDPEYGTHSRYLLARVHHLDGERQEAQGHYEGVLADYAKQKQEASEALKHPERFKDDSDEKARLEGLVKGPPPDHVARATFLLAVLQYEDGKFADAVVRFTAVVGQFPNSPMAAEARLHQGFCQVQLRQFADAPKTLQPLIDKEPRLADQALLWLAKAQAGAADPNNPQAFQQTMKTALDTFLQAAERAGQMAAADPEAKSRRGEILLEMADAQQAAKLYKEAAATYNGLLNEKLLPNRDEEVLQHLAAALHLAGDYAESDKICQRFREVHPKSTLLPAVLFRHAENAYFAGLAAAKLPNPTDRAREVARWADETIKRYQVVVEKYPEFTYANLACYGLGMALYRKGDLEKAKEVLESIPAAERNGDLTAVSYQLADIVLRLAPDKADDALAAGKLEEALKGATELLEGFVGSQPNGPQTPDALLKLGYCHQRMAALLSQPPEQAKEVAAARATYEQIMQRFPKHELFPQAVFERAKCQALAKDVNGAINELRRFNNDPVLKQAPVTPMALLHLATLLRGQNKANEAADVLNGCRQQHEANLQKDPARASWVPLLQYHHGIALREAGKRADARAIFEQVIRNSPNHPEAVEAALRFGQSLKDDAAQKVADGKKRLAAGNLKPEEIAAGKKMVDDGLKDYRDAVQYLQNQAEQLKQKQPDSPARARMMYEAAWACRSLAENEVEAARLKIQQEQWQKRRDQVLKQTPPGQQPPAVPLPVVPLSAIPLQPAENQTRTQYQSLITAFPDLAINADARFELAELLSERGDHDAALKLLREAIDKEPGPELTDKIRIRLGACLQAKGDAKAALAQFQAVAQNPKSPLFAQATYRAGECLLQTGDHAEAVKRLSAFRDQPGLQNLPGLTDRALLRLGHALAHLKQWDASRQAHEQVVARFGNGPWVAEARYGIGWAFQNQSQYDNAVNAYSQVTGAVATELAAKAQFQIGLCRLEQKRYPDATAALLVVPCTYDYPEWTAGALVEAARSLTEQKQREQAARLLKRVLRDHPDSAWAEVAKKRLEALN
jgi:TolA-binding protein